MAANFDSAINVDLNNRSSSGFPRFRSIVSTSFQPFVLDFFVELNLFEFQ